MLNLMLAFLAAIRILFRTRLDISLEVLALQQQVAVLKRKRPRPSLNRLDRFFWTTLRQIWPRWLEVLVIVKPETVVGWHRAGYRLYWRWRSRPRGGRPKVSEEIRTLVRGMATENSSWGAPKIHGELQKLGFEISERTIARHLQRLRRRGDPAKHWLAFLANHRELIVAFDFFTVPTLTFQLLYCFFVIGLRPKHTSVQAPWQNAVAERRVRNIRNELLDHVIVLNEHHLRRLAQDYLCYYHRDRTHEGLNKDTPAKRPTVHRNNGECLQSMPRLGGLHHRYSWAKAA